MTDDKKVQEAARAAMAEFVKQCHEELDRYLESDDPETDFPVKMTLIAYAAQGFGLTVQMNVYRPEEETPKIIKA